MTHRGPDHRRRGPVVGGGTWPRRSPAGLLHVLLELLHVSLELGPPVLEPANNLKNEILIPVFCGYFFVQFVFV